MNIIKKIHDQSTLKHFDVRRICKYLNKWYYWSKVKELMNKYVKSCYICKRFKTIRDKYSDLLNFLLISNWLWTNIIMNFVIELFESRDFNVILIMINKFIKMHHYVFCKAEKNDTCAEKITKLLFNHVWKLHKLSNIIIFDRDSPFIFLIWKKMCQTLKINIKLSIAFHLETNEQSEIVNQRIKSYLRSYCHYQQDNQFEWLLMIKFAFNVVISVSTKLFVITNLNRQCLLIHRQKTVKDQQKNEYWIVEIWTSLIKWRTSEISLKRN